MGKIKCVRHNLIKRDRHLLDTHSVQKKKEKEKKRKEKPTAPGIPRRSPIQVLTRPDPDPETGSGCKWLSWEVQGCCRWVAETRKNRWPKRGVESAPVGTWRLIPQGRSTGWFRAFGRCSSRLPSITGWGLMEEGYRGWGFITHVLLWAEQPPQGLRSLQHRDRVAGT